MVPDHFLCMELNKREFSIVRLDYVYNPIKDEVVNI